MPAKRARDQSARRRNAPDELDEPIDEEVAADAPPERREISAPQMSAAKAAEVAWRQLADLTGKQPLGVTFVRPEEDAWVVGVEVLEHRRVPSSADILAVYEAEIDMDETLLSYRRIRRYPRGWANGSEAP